MRRFGPGRSGKEIGHSRSDAGSSWRSSIASRKCGHLEEKSRQGERHLREREEKVRLDEEPSRQEQARLDREELLNKSASKGQILLDEKLSRREQARLDHKAFVEQE